MELIDRYRCVALAVVCYETATDEALGPPTKANRSSYRAHVVRQLTGYRHLLVEPDYDYITDTLMAMAPVFDRWN